MSEDREDARKGSREDGHQDTEVVLMAFWRRVIEEGCGPEMSLTEAAAVLGASVASVRRRVADGVIPAYRDARGRIRIVPKVAPALTAMSPVAVLEDTDEEDESPVSATMVGRLLDELRNTREQLNMAMVERGGLQKEKAAAEAALEHTKEEIGALWRLLSSRGPSEPRIPAVADSRASVATRAMAEAPARAPIPIRQNQQSGMNVSKIQSQITGLRKIAKRRKWPWALVG